MEPKNELEPERLRRKGTQGIFNNINRASSTIFCTLTSVNITYKYLILKPMCVKVIFNITTYCTVLLLYHVVALQNKHSAVQYNTLCFVIKKSSTCKGDL